MSAMDAAPPERPEPTTTAPAGDLARVPLDLSVFRVGDDPLSATLAARRVGWVGALGHRVAQQLGALFTEHDPWVLLALALAAEAPQEGHICLSLPQQAARLDALHPYGPRPILPPYDAWRARLEASPLVGQARAGQPLVLSGPHLYLEAFWQVQRQLVRALRARLAAGPLLDPTSPALQAALEAVMGPAPARFDLQRLAVAVAAQERLSIVTGGPGTGKTTTVTHLLAVLLALSPAERLRIELIAPTGKAAARLVEAVREAARAHHAELLPHLPESPQTVHRALGLSWGGQGGAEGDPIVADVVVVDEASMIDLVMMNRLVNAVDARARLVLLGDPDQLESVEAGAVLADLCESAEAFSPASAQRLAPLLGSLPEALVAAEGQARGLQAQTVRLRRSWRFTADSDIGRLASAVLAGEVQRALALLQRPGSAQLRFIAPSPELFAQLGPSLRQMAPGDGQSWTATEALAALGRVRVLCAGHEGRWGVRAVNAAIEAWLAAQGALSTRSRFYVGRPVMVTQNDYDVRLFNGDTGVVVETPQGRKVCFPGLGAQGPRFFSVASVPQHQTVFATTVHKSQGSEFDEIVLFLPERAGPILSRSLLYTALSRARAKLTVVGRAEIFEAAVRTQVLRSSGLAAHLAAEIEAADAS